jgi:Ca-activated chloride channel family protein
LPSPNAEISAAVIDLFQITKRKATVLLVLDVSGSMEGDKIRTARSATVEFLQRLDANDKVGVMIFSDGSQLLQEPIRKGDVAETLSPRVEGLVADGNTALYRAVCESVKAMDGLQREDSANGETRLYGIVLLSDGEETVGDVTENQMFATCLPANAEADGVKIFPIAFGEDADETVLARMATVTGGLMFTADPASISNVYLSISAEQ